MGAYESGVHSETEAGPIDVGLVVTDDGLGIAIDAPVIGSLRAAFDVLDDGTTKLTSLSRQGVPVLGLTDHARTAGLEVELESAISAHTAAQDELAATRQQLTETSVKLSAAVSEAAAAKKTAEELQARCAQAQAELAASRKAQGETEGRLRRAQTQADLNKDELAAKTGAAEAELAELTARLTQAEELRAAQDALLEQSRAELARAIETRDAETQRADANAAERDEAQRKLQLEEDTRRFEVERITAELADLRIAHAEAAANDSARAMQELQSVADQLDTEKARSVGLEVELVEARQTMQRQKADLDEERERRDEMVRDLAFIQTQVSDLASTKGSLVSRIKQMSERETRRLRTTTEMTDVLRTAEVVAADTKVSARRFEARAAKLEDQVRGMTQEIVEVRGRAEVAENSVRMLGEQLAKATRERDALKIDVVFFQKQIGALQRAAAEKAQPKPKK